MLEAHAHAAERPILDTAGMLNRPEFNARPDLAGRRATADHVLPKGRDDG